MDLAWLACSLVLGLSVINHAGEHAHGFVIEREKLELPEALVGWKY